MDRQNNTYPGEARSWLRFLKKKIVLVSLIVILILSTIIGTYSFLNNDSNISYTTPVTTFNPTKQITVTPTLTTSPTPIPQLEIVQKNLQVAFLPDTKIQVTINSEIEIVEERKDDQIVKYTLFDRKDPNLFKLKIYNTNQRMYLDDLPVPIVNQQLVSNQQIKDLKRIESNKLSDWNYTNQAISKSKPCPTDSGPISPPCGTVSIILDGILVKSSCKAEDYNGLSLCDDIVSTMKKI